MGILEYYKALEGYGKELNLLLYANEFFHSNGRNIVGAVDGNMWMYEMVHCKRFADQLPFDFSCRPEMDLSGYVNAFFDQKLYCFRKMKVDLVIIIDSIKNPPKEATSTTRSIATLDRGYYKISAFEIQVDIGVLIYCGLGRFYFPRLK